MVKSLISIDRGRCYGFFGVLSLILQNNIKKMGKEKTSYHDNYHYDLKTETKENTFPKKRENY